MASDHIGLICSAETGQVVAVINPDEEVELDNPRWMLIQIGAPVALVRIPRNIYMEYTSHEQVQAFAELALKKI